MTKFNSYSEGFLMQIRNERIARPLPGHPAYRVVVLFV